MFPRFFIHVVLNSNASAIQRYLACPSVPVVVTGRAVPTGGHRYYFSSTSCRCIRVRELLLLLL